MSAQTPNRPPEMWGVRFLGFILRLFFVGVIGVALGAGLYFGALALYRNYTQAVQINAERLSTLEARLDQDEQASKQRVDDLTARLGTLETLDDAQKAALADLQSRLAAVESAQSTQAATLDSLSKLPASLADYQSGLETVQKTQATLQADIKALQDSAAASNTRLQTLEAIWAGVETPLAALERDLQLVKVMELITRSRFALAQNNLGLAREDIQTGREVVLALQAGASGDQQTRLGEIAARLDAALRDLPARPVAAADELDGAWSLLLQELPEAAPAESLPAATPTPTAQP
jgi:chromosome segregation ATPase